MVYTSTREYKRTRGPRRNELTDSPMMAQLIESMEAGVDIGDYGRLAFVMTARYFMSDTEIVTLLVGQPGMDEEKAGIFVHHILEEDYNPPTPERILEWQVIQEYSILPDPDDPDSYNVYRQLRFPQAVYDSVGQTWRKNNRS